MKRQERRETDTWMVWLISLMVNLFVQLKNPKVKIDDWNDGKKQKFNQLPPPAMCLFVFFPHESAFLFTGPRIFADPSQSCLLY